MKMLKVAITGNIASGKSELEKLLQQKGYKVFDTDEISHDLTANDAEVISRIKKIFKNHDILSQDGEISRPKLGKLVFSDKNLLAKIESILHPAIKYRIERIFDEWQSEKVIFVSVPLLFEKKFDVMFDKVILVTADEDKRLSRLLKRSNYDINHARSRIQSQITQEEKISLSDYLIDNNSKIEDLEPQLELILSKLNSL